MKSLKEKSLKGLLWDFIGRIGLQGVGFFVSIILARILAPEDFGLLAIITVLINLASVFLDFGFSTALIQQSEVNDLHYSSVFYINVAMGFIFALIVYAIAPFIASFYDNSSLKNLIRFMSLSFIVNSFGNVMRARLRREMNFKSIASSNISAALISGTGAVYMAWAGYGVWSLAVQSVTNQVLANIILYFLSSRQINLGFNFQSLKDLWLFSSRMFFSSLLDTLFNNADSLIIGKILNTSTLGFYYRAKSLEDFSMRYTSSTISSVLLPGLSSLQHDMQKLKHAVIKVFHLLSFISFIGCGLLLVSSREIIILLFSIKWEPSVIMFQILIAGAFASQIFSLFYNTLLSTGNINTYLKINALNKFLLFLNFSTLALWGLEAYLIIFTLIRLITFFIGMICVSNILNLGGLLFKYTMEYLSIYGLSVLIVFVLQSIIHLNNMYQYLIVLSFLYITIFILLSYFAKCHGLKLFLTEIIKPLKSHI